MSIRNGEFMILDGEMVPFADAKIHCLAPAITYAANVFEGLRAYWNEADQELYVFRVDDHLARLDYSARMLRFGSHPYDHERLRADIVRLLRANGARESVHLRIHLYIDTDGMITAREPVGMFISCVFRPRAKAALEGCTAQVSSWARLSDAATPPRIKTTANYVNGRLAALQARQDGYDTAILLNEAGDVSEGPAACFFMVRDGRLVTPDASRNILESITRDTLIRCAPEWIGEAVIERRIARSELHACDEAFFCGTGQEIAPILSIDGLPVGDGRIGPLTRKLQERYFALVGGEDASHPQWRMPVHA
jgi:branched-chain amino acid aminotransferase